MIESVNALQRARTSHLRTCVKGSVHCIMTQLCYSLSRGLTILDYLEGLGGVNCNIVATTLFQELDA